MKINLKPKTYLGKISIGLILLFFLFLGIFFLFIKSGERGGATFFSNLKLTIPFLTACLFAISSFFTGTISIIKDKEGSILVFLSALIGFLVFVWCFLEILFPH